MYNAIFLQTSHAFHSHVSTARFQVLDKPIDKLSSYEAILVDAEMIATILDQRRLLTMQSYSQILASYNEVSFTRTDIRILSHSASEHRQTSVHIGLFGKARFLILKHIHSVIDYRVIN